MKMLNAVYLQPTFACALDCKGCYVKESTQGEQITRNLWYKLIKYLWTNTEIIPDQITLAIDNLPSEDYWRERLIMKSIFLDCLDHKMSSSDKEFHITVNSIPALLEYGMGSLLSYIDLVSISHITEKDIPALENLRDHGAKKINYNYSPTVGLKGYREILPHVDMSYYVLHKAGLGRDNDASQIEVFKNGLREIGTWSTTEKEKIVVDGCVRDSFKFLQTGYGCSANISRLHIWPDGHVTGCPYNKDGGTPAKSLEEVISNIKEVLKVYEFNKCTIPRDYHSKVNVKWPLSQDQSTHQRVGSLPVIHS